MNHSLCFEQNYSASFFSRANYPAVSVLFLPVITSCSFPFSFSMPVKGHILLVIEGVNSLKL